MPNSRRASTDVFLSLRSQSREPWQGEYLQRGPPGPPALQVFLVFLVLVSPRDPPESRDSLPGGSPVSAALRESGASPDSRIPRPVFAAWPEFPQQALSPRQVSRQELQNWRGPVARGSPAGLPQVDPSPRPPVPA